MPDMHEGRKESVEPLMFAQFYAGVDVSLKPFPGPDSENNIRQGGGNENAFNPPQKLP